MRKMDNRAAQGSQLLTMMLVMFVMMFIFADPNISALIAVTLDSVFYPLIGFGGSCPVLTIILAGILVYYCLKGDKLCGFLLLQYLSLK